MSTPLHDRRSESSDPARLLVLLLLANRFYLGQPGAVGPAGIRLVVRSTTRDASLHVNVRLHAILLAFGPPLPVALRPRVSRVPVDS